MPALVAALTIVPIVRDLAPFILVYSPAEAVRKIYPGNQFAEIPELAERLQAVTAPGDKVFVFGAEPQLLYYAKRVSATRYIFLNPLYGRRQQAAVQEILRHQPKAIVVLPNNVFFLPGTEQFFTRWAESYASTFRRDAYIAVDPSGHGHIILVGDGADMTVRPDYSIVGALLVARRQSDLGRAPAK
jgi:hypothetical protein